MMIWGLNESKKITMYSYLYYHLYELVSTIRRFNARESAIIYLSAIVSFLTIPFVGFLLSTVLPSKYNLIFIILLGGYSFLVFYINKKYFEKESRLKGIYSKFKNQSTLQRKIGYVVVVLTFFLSLVLFFIFLSLF